MVTRGRRNRSKHDTGDDLDFDDNRRKKNKSKTREDELNEEIEALRRQLKSKTDDESDTEIRKSRHRRNRSKPRDEDGDSENVEEDIRRERTKKSDRHRKEDSSKERRGKKSRKDGSEDREHDLHNNSVSKETEVTELPSPREKVGLPMDLSWRHMTKAEKRRLDMARQRLLDEEEK